MRQQHGSTSLLDYAAATAIGAMRMVNEDAFGAFPESEVYVVADGCGGSASGENAAKRAVAAFADLPRRAPELARAGIGPAEADPLALAVMHANIEIFQESLTRRELMGQGATLCAVRISTHAMSILHIGDCRVGRQRGGNLDWLTEDHSLVAALRMSGASEQEIIRLGQSHPNVITRAVGILEQVAVDLSYHPTAPGETYLLCSDGLTRHVEHAAIAGLAGDPARSLPERCAALLEAAEAAGGHDNTTVILLRLHPAA